MKLRGLLLALLMFASLPGWATTVQLFQILSGGTVQCSGCNPALANTDTFYRLNVLDDSGNTAGPGTFAILQNGTPIASGLPWPSATLTFKRNLPAGTYVLSIVYTPSASNTVDVAASAQYTVWFGSAAAGDPTTAIAVSATPNPTTVSTGFGAVAQVTGMPGNAVTGGQVQFSLDGLTQPPVAVSHSGQAVFNFSGLVPGNHTIRATYVPDATHAGSTSDPYIERVNKDNSTIAVSSSLNPSLVGNNVTFTAAVNGTIGNPGGTVTFVIDGATQAPISLGLGTTAAFTTSFPTPGNRSVVANYSGGVMTNAGSGSLAGGQQVKAAPTLALGSSANPSVFGQTVSLNATVSGVGPTPTGTVQFTLDGANLGAPVALNASGVASISVPAASLTVGTHPAGFSYSGDASYTAGTPAALAGGQVVNAAATTTALSSSVNPAAAGANVIFTATVSSAAGTPGGNVVFTLDGTPQTPVPLNGAAQAVFSISTLAPGSHTITAAYGGNASYASSASLPLTQSIALAPSAVTLASSANPAPFGQSITLTATVSNTYPGVPTGSVSFTVDGVPTTVALNSARQASLTFTPSPGPHIVVATYSGDATFASSTSASFAQVVTPPAVPTLATSRTLLLILACLAVFAVAGGHGRREKL